VVALAKQTAVTFVLGPEVGAGWSGVGRVGQCIQLGRSATGPKAARPIRISWVVAVTSFAEYVFVKGKQKVKLRPVRAGRRRLGCAWPSGSVV
jgi:hypothetical protein